MDNKRILAASLAISSVVVAGIAPLPARAADELT